MYTDGDDDCFKMSPVGGLSSMYTDGDDDCFKMSPVGGLRSMYTDGDLIVVIVVSARQC